MDYFDSDFNQNVMSNIKKKRSQSEKKLTSKKPEDEIIKKDEDEVENPFGLKRSGTYMNSDLNQVVKLDPAGLIPPLLKAELKVKIDAESDDDENGLDIFQPNPSL